MKFSHFFIDRPIFAWVISIITVIVGGLLKSTLAEFFVRPALFWTIGRSAGKQILEDKSSQVLKSHSEVGTVPNSIST